MSLIPSLLFLLCISFHASNARRLGAIPKEPDTKSLFPNKNDDKTSPGAAKEEMVKQISRVEKEYHKRLSSLKAKKMKAVKTESLLSNVSWHLPDKKQDEEQPEFNLDYSSPKTHPPVHN